MTEADCEACGLWPVIVDVDGDAYTLWGPAGGEDDLLLADAQELVAFRRWPDLVAFVADDRQSSLSGRSGYRELQQRLAQPGNRVPVELKRYPVSQVGAWLRAGGMPATKARWAAALDCLNILWDAARTIGDEVAARALKRGGGPLAELMDALSFVESSEQLDEVRWGEAADAYDALWARLRPRWRVA